MGVQDPPFPALQSSYGHAAASSAYRSQYQQYPAPQGLYVPHLQYAPTPPAYPGIPSGPSRKRKAPGPAGSGVVDLTQDAPPKKRKSNKSQTSGKPKKADDTGSGDVEEGKRKKKAKKPKDEEKRLRRWRTHAPSSYLEVRSRVLTQRMICLNRQRDILNPDHPTETISLAGTTGNVYTIIVDKVPSCDCPHAKKGNQCKHIAYVLSRVLRAPANLEYQLALTSTELREIFAKAPPLPSETAGNEERDGKRKPIEGECPICSEDFEPDSREAIVYCKAACGNNIHSNCFKQWAVTKKGREAVTCPFCRTPWQGEGDAAAAKDVARDGPKNGEGYVNVAVQLGLSGRRDYSSYHSYWVRRQAINGEIS